MRSPKHLFSRLWKEQSAATALEYSLIAALIACVLITALTSVGTNLSESFMRIVTNLEAARG
jgi:pilus assembly protein Flp/PilA